MSFDDLHASNGGQPATEAVDIELDVRILASLAAEGEEDDAELLARLDSADTVASGVEARLDEILGTLDGLLTSLEPKDTSKQQQDPTSPSEAPSGRPPSE